MSKKIVILNPDFPYHLSARCINKEWFQIPLSDVWTIMCDYLYFLKIAYNVEIISFVLMSNHWHLIALFPEANWGLAMNYFMRETSLRVSRASGRINQIYGGPHFKSMIGSTHYFETVYKYVYQNPYYAGLCERVEQYPFSTLHGLLGQSQLAIPLIEDTLLLDNVDQQLKWLNTPPDKNHYEAVRNGLRRGEFSFAKQVGSGRASPFEILKY